MKKKNIFTIKLITSALLITGLSSFPVSALEQQLSLPVAQSNNQNAKLSITEDNGHFYVVVNAEQNITNLVINVTADNNKKFTFKHESLKKGEEAKFELELAPTTTYNNKKTLPNTSVVRDTLTLSNIVGGHSFTVYASYDVHTNTVSTSKTKVDTTSTSTSLEDIMKTNPDMSSFIENKNSKDKSFDSSKTLPKDDVTKKDEDKTEDNKVTNKENINIITTDVNKNSNNNSNTENKKDNTIIDNINTDLPTAPPKPETGDVKPSDAPAEIVKNNKETSNSEVKSNTMKTTSLNTEIKNDTNKVITTETSKEVKAAVVKSIDSKTSTVTPTNVNIEDISSSVREEQIKKEFLKLVNLLRNSNGLAPLTENTLLNNSTKIRVNEVVSSPIDSSIHGKGGSKEIAAARKANYSNSILYNISQITDRNYTPKEAARKLLDVLYLEINNVTGKTYPYGHRNTLLHSGATETGASVIVKNGTITIVQHLNYGNAGAFNGTTPIPSVYLDGKSY